MKKLIFALAFFFSLQAFAVSWDKSSDFVWTQSSGKISVFPGPGSGQVWSVNDVKPSALGPTLQRQKALPFNPSPTANFKATFTPKAIANALLNPASAIITLAGAAIINEVLDSACVRVFGGGMQIAPGGQWEECKFKDVVETIYTVEVSGQSEEASSPLAACSGAAAKANAVAAGAKLFTVVGLNAASTSCIVEFKQRITLDGLTFVYETVGRPEYEISSSSKSTKARDGYKPSTLEAVKLLVEPAVQRWSQSDFLYGYEADRGKANRLLDVVLQSGNGVAPDVTVTGPASSQPVTKTTVNSDGSTKTETTTDNYKYTKISPSSSTVTSTTVSTTNNTTNTTTNNTPSTTTTTTTTTAPTEPAEDHCVKNPDTIGCSKYGEAPKTEEVPQIKVPVSFEPVQFDAPAGCPAPITGNINVLSFSQSYEISYQPMCDVMEYMRYLFLAIGAVASAWLFMEGLKP